MLDRRSILIVGALLGALFFYLAVRSLDWGALADALKLSQRLYVALVPVCLLLYLAVKVRRWRYLIRPLVDASTMDLMPAVLAGNAGNYVFPHAGEIARAILANRRLGVPTSALLASVAVERMFDFLALLLIAIVVLIPVGRMSPDMQMASYLVGALCAVIFVAVLVFMVRTEDCLRLAERVLTPMPARLREGVSRHLRASSAGLSAVAKPGLLLAILLLSVLQWLLVVACVAFSLKAVVSVSLAAAVSVLLLNVIGLTLPAAPAHVGTVQLAFTVALTPFGVSHADAFAGSVIYNFLMVVPTLILGLPGLRHAGLELRARLGA